MAARATSCDIFAIFSALCSRFVGENAFQSQWVSKWASGEWLVVDLGAPSRVDRVNVHWVNVGSIEGAFLRKSFDVTELVRFGAENRLAVRIRDGKLVVVRMRGLSVMVR